MRIAIVGSRDFPFLEMVLAYLETLEPKEHTIISGGAEGVDTFAINIAKRMGFKTEVIPAQWKDSDGRIDKLAGFKRNIKLVDASDSVVAFWDLMSRGTAHTIAYACLRNKIGKIFTN